MAYPWSSGDQLNAADLDDAVEARIKSLTAMEAITAGNPVALGLYQSTNPTLDFKAIGLLSSSGANTIAKTVGSNSNRVLVVITSCESDGGGQASVALTWNGVAPTTEYDVQNTNRDVHVAIWIAPATGAHNLVITTTHASTTLSTYAVYSLYNVSQSTTPDAHSLNISNPDNTTHSLTVNTDGAVAIGFISTIGGTIGTVSGTAFVADTQTQAATSGGAASGDSGLSSPAGAGNSVTITQSNTGATGLWALLVFAPANAVTLGVQKASSASAATVVNRRINFIGFAATTVSAGQPLAFYLSGLVTNQSGLTSGAQYYLNDTNGTIGTSAGTVSRKVGIAASNTALLITNIW